MGLCPPCPEEWGFQGLMGSSCSVNQEVPSSLPAPGVAPAASTEQRSFVTVRRHDVTVAPNHL